MTLANMWTVSYHLPHFVFPSLLQLCLSKKKRGRGGPKTRRHMTNDILIIARHLRLGVISQSCIYFRCSFGYQKFLQEVSVKRRPMAVERGASLLPSVKLLHPALHPPPSPRSLAAIFNSISKFITARDFGEASAVYTSIPWSESLRRLRWIVGRRAWLSPTIPLCGPCVTQMTKSVTADSSRSLETLSQRTDNVQDGIVFSFASFQAKHRRKHKHESLTRPCFCSCGRFSIPSSITRGEFVPRVRAVISVLLVDVCVIDFNGAAATFLEFFFPLSSYFLKARDLTGSLQEALRLAAGWGSHRPESAEPYAGGCLDTGPAVGQSERRVRCNPALNSQESQRTLWIAAAEYTDLVADFQSPLS